MIQKNSSRPGITSTPFKTLPMTKFRVYSRNSSHHRSASSKKAREIDRDYETCQVAADLSGILGVTLGSMIGLCDQENISIKTVVDKEWLKHFMRAYDLLF